MIPLNFDKYCFYVNLGFVLRALVCQHEVRNIIFLLVLTYNLLNKKHVIKKTFIFFSV